MTTTQKNLLDLQQQLAATPQVQLVAVSKTKPVEQLMEIYELGVRAFGENYVQELVAKQPQMPADVQWHFIGHLQTNKVKYIAPFVQLIQSVDSEKLLREINKQAAKNNRKIDCLLQIHIAEEETKTGFSVDELEQLLAQNLVEQLPNVQVIGLMGMSTLTANEEQVKAEFRHLKQLFDSYQKQLPTLKILSMGMSGDWPLAVAEGSNLIRVGSSIFGERLYAEK